MKLAHLLTGIAVVSLLAACAGTDSDDAASSSNAFTEKTTLPSAAAAAVKLATGRDVSHVTALPVYEPDAGSAPAFFEVDLAPGWAIVSNEVAPSVVEWNDSGRSPSQRLSLGARAAMERLYRLDTAVYVAADAKGNAVGASTKSLVRIDRSGPETQLVAVTPDEALEGFHAAKLAVVSRVSDGWLRMQDAPIIGNTPPATTCTVPGDVPSYSQLNPHEGVNTTNCDSGCGPTAWATVFGWASRRAAVNPSVDASFASIFQVSGSAVEAPLTMDDDVATLSMKINGVVKTMCVQGQGATTPWSMANVKNLVDPSVTVDVHYNLLMMADAGVRDQAIAAICDGRPSIIGIGSLFGGDGHFPIAKGYDNGKFLLEMGWGGDGNGWYDAKTWFTGSVHH